MAEFDLFINYSTADRLAVETIARCLRDEGVNPFLDRWYLVAGQPWPERLEQILANCKAVAVSAAPFWATYRISALECSL